MCATARPEQAIESCAIDRAENGFYVPVKMSTSHSTPLPCTLAATWITRPVAEAVTVVHSCWGSDAVVCRHFDHVGGLLVEPDGDELQFPNAKARPPQLLPHICTPCSESLP